MHNEHVSRTIELVQSQILQLEQELAEKKRMVNSLCGLIDRTPVYANADPNIGASVGIRSDEFYGKPLASVVRAILEKRNAAGLGAASLDEIYNGMMQGGYRFDAKNDATAKRALSISLAKNSVTFHKLPNGNIGLTEWYPEAAKMKAMNGKREEEETAKNEELQPPQTKTQKESESETPDGDEQYHNDFATDEDDPFGLDDAQTPRRLHEVFEGMKSARSKK